MPLAGRTRIEVYVPDSIDPAYQELLDTLDREFTFTFGGSTIIQGMDGSYLSKIGRRIRDRIAVVYTDVDLTFDENMPLMSSYADWLRAYAVEHLHEEALLVVAYQVYHSG